jgi:uncharacterized spore protein YtfJ
MKIDELFARTRESAKAELAYAEPVEKDGTTVIPAARVAVGGGGGTGQDKNGQQGEGGGLGLTARPVGAYVIKDGELRWAPAVDVNRLVVVIGAVVVAALFAAVRIGRDRRRTDG